jgi:hypothetical protein
MNRATAVWEVEGPAVALGLASQASMAGPLPQPPSQRFEPCRLVQQISVPICACPPLGVALRIAPETYETAALRLSYLGATPSIGDAQETAALRPRASTFDIVLKILAQRSNS